MGPRSYERGNPSAEQVRRRIRDVLQWGRVLTNAETTLRQSRLCRPRRLQWGRVLTNAETNVHDYGHVSPRSRFNGAAFLRTRKRRAGRRTSRGRRCFNGAAFLRTRKLVVSATVRATAVMLQWGRVLTNAETALPDGSTPRFPLASMGPRSYERGNLVCQAEFAAIHALQWGRVLTNAGTEGGNRTDFVLESFNGAAFLRTRKLGRGPVWCWR